MNCQLFYPTFHLLPLEASRDVGLVYYQISKITNYHAKLLKYMIMFKEILTFLGLDYRANSLITLYLVVIGISIQKIR